MKLPRKNTLNHFGLPLRFFAPLFHLAKRCKRAALSDSQAVPLFCGALYNGADRGAFRLSSPVREEGGGEGNGHVASGCVRNSRRLPLHTLHPLPTCHRLSRTHTETHTHTHTHTGPAHISLTLNPSLFSSQGFREWLLLTTVILYHRRKTGGG